MGISRRDLLEIVGSVGMSGLTGCSSAQSRPTTTATQSRTTPTPDETTTPAAMSLAQADRRTSDQAQTATSAIRGRILGPKGNPVGGATVYAYHPDSQTVLQAQTSTTTPRGEFTVPANAGTNILVWRKGQWFGGGHRTTAGTTVGDRYLDSQLLFGPAPATNANGTETTMVSMWRRVRTKDPRTQVFYVELTGDPQFTQRSGGVAYGSNSGIVTLRFPEDGIRADYGKFPAIDSYYYTYRLPGVQSLNEAAVFGADTELSRINSYVDTSRTLTLPVYALARGVTEPIVAPISQVTAKRLDRLNQAVRRALSAVPLVGSVIGLGDTLQWASDIFNLRNKVTAGNPSQVGTFNPHTEDALNLAWNKDQLGSEATVIAAIPVRFKQNTRHRLTATATWKTASRHGVFGTTITVSDSVPTVGNTGEDDGVVTKTIELDGWQGFHLVKPIKSDVFDNCGTRTLYYTKNKRLKSYIFTKAADTITLEPGVYLLSNSSSNTTCKVKLPVSENPTTGQVSGTKGDSTSVHLTQPTTVSCPLTVNTVAQDGSFKQYNTEGTTTLSPGIYILKFRSDCTIDLEE